MRAQGHFTVFLSSLLERRGVVAAAELGKRLQLYAEVVGVRTWRGRDPGLLGGGGVGERPRTGIGAIFGTLTCY